MSRSRPTQLGSNTVNRVIPSWKLHFLLNRKPTYVIMIAGSFAGGWFSGHYAQKADPRKMRYVVIGVGLLMSAYFFVTTR